MADLKDNPTLADIQAYIKQVNTERGFAEETVSEVFTILVEEVGELAKALRKNNGQKMDANSQSHELEHEAADVFTLLIDLCNKLGIDLEHSLRDKEEKNKRREWK